MKERNLGNYHIGKTSRGYVAYYQCNAGTYYSRLKPATRELTGCHTATGGTLESLSYFADCYKSYSGAYRHALRAMNEGASL